jgi:addiction module HigA family antidote
MRMHNPPHPGLVLREYLGDLAVTKAAAHLRITRVTLSRVLNGKAGISAAMAIRLAAALGTTPELWMNMQSQYDLWQARRRRQPAVKRLAHAAETAGDFFKKRAEKASRTGLMKFLRTAPKSVPESEDEMR